MEFDAFHHWLWTRPLIFFVLTLPLAVAALAGWFKHRHEAPPERPNLARRIALGGGLR